MKKIESLEERIEILKSQTIIRPNGCWIFQGATRGEYGETWWNNKIVSVHRLSAHYYLKLNLSDTKKYALHKIECSSKLCWNPDHLYIGDANDNMNDSVLMGHRSANREATHCKNGHEFNERNTYIYKKRRMCRECNRIHSRRNKKLVDKDRQHWKV